MKRVPKRRFSFCESVSATRNVWHVRETEWGEEPKLSGGIETGPLAECWKGNGWDINRPFDLDEAIAMSRTRDDQGSLMACPRCVAVVMTRSAE